jgi:arylsulfatase A
MNRRAFLKSMGVGGAAVAVPGLINYSCRKPAEKLPNIVYILADDLGYGDVSCLNSEGKIKTSNIDRLAKEGMVFTDAHSGSAVCTPTRYGILTGRYAWRSRLKSGVLWGYSPPLIESNRMTVASMLKSKGYATAGIGKWHLGLDYTLTDGRQISQLQKNEKYKIDYGKPIEGPVDLGFDYYFGIPASLDMVPYVYIENDRSVNPPSDKVEGREGYEFFRGGPASPGFNHEEVLPKCTEKAVAFIDRSSQQNPDKPLFLYFALNAPHTPILPADEFKGKSGIGPYGDFVLQCDYTVGRIIDALERTGRKDNTLFIFTSDNGCSPMANFEALSEKGHHPSYHFRGYKADIFEGGHRIPFIASWPGKIKPGTESEDTICLTDLMATAADICNVKLPDNAGEDSYSILPDLLGTAEQPIREATVHHSVNGYFSIRQGKWKLELCPGSGGWSYPVTEKAMSLGLPMVQLYDLTRDISEQENLQAEYPDVVNRLTNLLESYVEKGRSTPGKPQKNEGDVDIWMPLQKRDEKHAITKVEHLGINKSIKVLNKAEVKFSEIGVAALLDGIRGTSWYKDGYWAGIEGDDFECLIDLGKVQKINSVQIGLLQDQNAWIFLPSEISIAVSKEKSKFTSPEKITIPKTKPDQRKGIKDFAINLESQSAKYIKISVKNIGTCPDWHAGAGGKSWIFIDEIMIN